jgi:hypothetical protein
MIHKKVISQREISPDGKSIAQAQTIATSSGDSNSQILQTITIKLDRNNHSYSSSSSSSSSNYSSSSSSSSSRTSTSS